MGTNQYLSEYFHNLLNTIEKEKESDNMSDITVQEENNVSENNVIKERPPVVTEKRKRGRPKGSKNKPKVILTPIDTHSAVAEKRKRGRPKGSKNKPKVILTPIDTN
jgi:hypothetical protein